MTHIEISEKIPDLHIDEKRYPLRYDVFYDNPPVYMVRWTTGEVTYIGIDDFQNLSNAFYRIDPDHYDAYVAGGEARYQLAMKAWHANKVNYTDPLILRS